jgi:hypothetical protein
MKNALLAFFVVPLLTVPAFAGSLSAGDKLMIVAEDVGVGVGNVGVGVGVRHRHRDRGDLYMSTRHRHTMTIAARISTARRRPMTHRSEQFDTDLGSAGRKLVSAAQALPLAPASLAQPPKPLTAPALDMPDQVLELLRR